MATLIPVFPCLVIVVPSLFVRCWDGRVSCPGCKGYHPDVEPRVNEFACTLLPKIPQVGRRHRNEKVSVVEEGRNDPLFVTGQRMYDVRTGRWGYIVQTCRTPLYQVRYSDGDVEELFENQLEELVQSERPSSGYPLGTEAWKKFGLYGWFRGEVEGIRHWYDYRIRFDGSNESVLVQQERIHQTRLEG